MKSIRYWAFCGNEGTGKTLLSKAFSERLGAYWTYEPNGETEILKSLRSTALTQNPEMTVKAREMLMMANRSIHNKKLIELLIDNKNSIVTDRCFFSGMVYASLEAMSFNEWLDLFHIASIKYIPDVLIYVRNKDRKIDKENDNIYDHATDDILKKIDVCYEEGLKFIKEYKDTRNIRVLEYDNNFNLSVEENVELLLEIIRRTILSTDQ